MAFDRFYAVAICEYLKEEFKCVQEKKNLKKLGIFFIFHYLNSEDMEEGSAVCVVVWQIMQYFTAKW